MDYRSEVFDIDQITKKIKITVSEAEFNLRYSKILTKVASKAEIKGFRAGKAPKEMIERIYGMRAKAEAYDELINDSYAKAYEEHNIDGVGYPKIEIKTAEEGKPLEFEAQLNVKPRPVIVGHDKIEVEVENEEVTDVNVQRAIDYMVKKRAKTEEAPADAKIAKGQLVEGEMQIKIGDAEPKTEPFYTEVGEEVLPKKVEESLLGLKIGDSKSVTETFTEDYDNRHYAGKVVEFNLTVKKISNREELELTAELVKEISNKEQSVEEFRESVKKKLIEQNQKSVKNEVMQKITDFLIEKNPFQVPQHLIDTEIKHMLSQLGMLDANKVDVEKADVSQYRTALNEICEKRAKAEIIFDQLFEQLNPEVPQAEIDAFIKEAYRHNSWEELPEGLKAKISLDKLKMYIGKPKLIENVANSAKVNYVAPKAKEN